MEVLLLSSNTLWYRVGTQDSIPEMERKLSIALHWSSIASLAPCHLAGLPCRAWLLPSFPFQVLLCPPPAWTLNITNKFLVEIGKSVITLCKQVENVRNNECKVASLSLQWILSDPWISGAQCGPNFLNSAGNPAECNPGSADPCCNLNNGWCGNTAGHCTCTRCLDFRIFNGMSGFLFHTPTFRRGSLCFFPKWVPCCFFENHLKTEWIVVFLIGVPVFSSK